MRGFCRRLGDMSVGYSAGAAESRAARRAPVCLQRGHHASRRRYVPCYLGVVLRIAAVLSTALALTGGSVAAHLCKAWCSPQGAAVSGCHAAESAAGTSVAGQDGCDDVAGIVGWLPEAVRRAALIDADSPAILVRPLDAPPGVRHDFPPRYLAAEASIGPPPLLLNLRI